MNDRIQPAVLPEVTELDDQEHLQKKVSDMRGCRKPWLESGL